MYPQNQLSVFILCAAIGFLGGIVYEPFSFLRLLLRCKDKRKGLGVAMDICFCVVFAVLSVTLTHLLHFPDFRLCYNKVTKLVKKAKNKDKTLKKRREKQI